jgi:anti-anti-sigma factor
MPTTESRGLAEFAVEDLAIGDDHTLVLTGELDITAGDVLEAAIIPCADAARLTLDLSGLSFMDVTGVRLVLLAQDLCKVRRIRFAVIPGPRQVQRTLEIAGFLDQLPIQTGPSG